jgi:hypothetical protein
MNVQESSSAIIGGTWVGREEEGLIFVCQKEEEDEGDKEE